MYIQLNGQVIYYEKSGEGSPVILVHGNGETHKTFGSLIPQLSKTHTVYALDSRGHGQSAPVTVYHYEDMAEDVAAFAHALDLVKPAFYGFSDGGIVGLIAASKFPTLFSSIAVSGANLKPRGAKLRYRVLDRLVYMKTKNPQRYLMLKEPHISKSDLGRIRIPALILAGSKDLIKKSETKRIAAAIPGSELMILPGEDHFSYVVNSPKLFPLLDKFLSHVEQ